MHRDFVDELRIHFTGDIRNDDASRILYSTDASIYQIEPLGVVLPRTQEDLQVCMELAARYHVPVVPRGSGSSLAGQAIGEAVIIDCSRWLDKLVSIDPEQRTATVEPGLVLQNLNRAAAKFGLQYGPDPASAERATMGGVIANNATGSHSITYGMTADHLISADVVMADGSLGVFREQDLSSGGNGKNDSSLLGALFRVALDIRGRDAQLIKEHYPRSWRNSAGYRLNYLLPWSATRPAQWASDHYPVLRPGTLNLAPLLAGSEGTLAIIRRATVNLVKKPKHAVLAILAYSDIAEACDAVRALLEHSPSAVELIPRMILQLARAVPGYASQMDWVSGDPAAVLVVEFSGDALPPLIESAKRLRSDVTIAVSPEEQARVWTVRRVGLGILDSRPQSARPAAFIEDCAIPVERLGDFVREIEALLDAYHTQGGIYAHASAGTLHIRPILDLKSADGVGALRPIAEHVLQLALRLGGAMSSEHGDGLARGEWLEPTYGSQLIDVMRSLKRAADPQGLLNPGKMFDAPRMDQQLRYGADYRSHPWTPALEFASNGGLATAIEQCNGQGVCRKDTGVMCPSFQATREEMHSTRGRANLLRSLITTGTLSGQPGRWDGLSEQRVFEALDLCLMCKGCKAECPSGVDMAKLKSEFLSKYYEHHARQLRDYLFGYFHVTARVLSSMAPVVNFGSTMASVRWLMARVLGFAPQRPFPKFASRAPLVDVRGTRPRVLFLRDAFTHYVDARIEQAAFDLLALAGFDVVPLKTVAGNAAFLSKGFVTPARRHSAQLLDEIRELDTEGRLELVGVEPSEVYAFRHEVVDLHPDRQDEVVRRRAHTWTVEEFLLRCGAFSNMRVAIKATKIYYHPHCHQKAEQPTADLIPTGPAATIKLLQQCGYKVELSDVGCCGMAGTFGYDAEHFELSQQVGSQRLFPRLHELSGESIAATGAACRMQIAQATGADVRHPIEYALQALQGVRPE